MKKLHFGIIGAGGIADRRTLPGMLLANNAEITAVMEIAPELAEKLRQKYGAKRAYTDAAALLDDPEIEAVYIASPVVFHAAQAKAAADRGKHILIEKPVAMTAAEGEDVVNYCESKGVKIAAGFMMRFGSHIMAMKQAVAEGRIGQVVSGYTQFTAFVPPASGNWRLDKKKSGGGALMDMGVHCIDLLEYVTGTRITHVASFDETVTFDYDVEDSSTALLRMENGAQCVVQTNFNIPDEAALWRFELFGTKGRLLGDNVIGQIDGGTLNALYMTADTGYDAAQDHAVAKGESIEGHFGNMYTREIESFADSVLSGKPLLVPASDAVHVQKVIELCYRSSEEKKIFTV